MTRKVTILTLFLGLLLMVTSVFAQDPIPIVTPVVVDSGAYNGVYRGVQSQFFCEPTTGNLVAAWYRYYSSGPNPRRITAATSVDGGATWTIHPEINLGVGAEMNARYATVSGTSMTPIVAYGDRNPGGDNRDSRPTVAYDIGGWGGGAFINLFADDIGTADTVLYGRYVSCATAPDNENLWAVGAYHDGNPGEGLYYYYSQDGGITWSRPRVVASAAAADIGKGNYVPDLSSSGLGVALGYNNTAFVSGLCQYVTDDDYVWQIIYASSDDMGNTWSPISAIPGADALNFSNGYIYRQFSSPLLDGAGNWHIFGVGRDTTEYNTASDEVGTFYCYDFRYDGSAWAISKVAVPKLLDVGIVAMGYYDFGYTYNFIDPSVGPDGTLYCSYADVVDTTGANGEVNHFNWNIMVMFSEDNGATWKGPVSVLDQWRGYAPVGVANHATDKLHIVYRRHFFTDQTDPFFYMGVPTDTIKARATSVEKKVKTIMPSNFALHQNFPNPFNPTTNITFDLQERVHVTLKIFNEMGQEVATLIDKPMDAGFKGITWNATDMPSGVYFYQLTAGNYSESKKMILTK